jgi:hypothetical protein
MSDSDEASVWIDRLREDRMILEAQLSPEQDAAVRRILESKLAGGQLEFLVVYGSVSRGEQRPGSDLDIYYETRDDAVEFQEADPESRWHVFGTASGALLASLRLGDEMAFAIVSDALVVYDDGAFRSLIAAADEERLKPASPGSRVGGIADMQERDHGAVEGEDPHELPVNATQPPRGARPL